VPVLADIRDEQRIARIIDHYEPEAIVHLAAIHHIPTCEQRRAETLDVNIIATERLLGLAEHAASVRAFLLASSGAVYDWIEGPLVEDFSPIVAHDNYGLSKCTNEAQLAFWATRTGKRARMARLFNVIGPDDPNAHLIPDICRQIDPEQRTVTLILGNVAPRRDYISVEDAARGFLALLTGMDEARAGEAEAFNVCTGIEHSVLDVVDAIANSMNCEISVRTDPARVRRLDRPSQLGSPDKTFAATNWRAADDFADTIARAAFVQSVARAD